MAKRSRKKRTAPPGNFAPPVKERPLAANVPLDSPSPQPSPILQPVLAPTSRKVILLQALVIVLTSLWIFFPALNGGWQWDDLQLIVGNSVIHNPSGLWKIWFQPGVFPDYYPLVENVNWLQWHFWQDHTFGYHLTNVVLHIINSLLVWRLLGKFGLRYAWVGGLLFALHPTAVESVAWMVELKNALSLPPMLLAMCAWIDYDEHRKRTDYVLSISLFFIALLCKLSVVLFPLVILLYAWWRRGRMAWSDLRTAAPFFALSLVLGLVAVWAGIWDREFVQTQLRVMPDGGVLPRLLLVGHEIAFYFARSFVPVWLLPIYPRWEINPSSPVQYLPWFVLGLVIWYLWTKRASWGRHVLLGLGFFLINLGPCPGFIPAPNMDFTWVMDHFLYLPIIGLIGLVVAAAEQIGRRLSSTPRLCGIGITVLALLLMACESRSYAGIYVNVETFCIYTIERNPGAWPAHNNLGNYLRQAEDLASAEAQFDQALQLNPNYAAAHANLGVLLAQEGRTSEAFDQFNAALKTDPGSADLHTNLGIALAQFNRWTEALDQFNTALKINPDQVDALASRGQLKRSLGDWNGALVDLDQALALDPASPQPYLNRGAIKEMQGDFPAALANLRRFRGLAPADPNADYAGLWIWIIRSQQNQKADADRELAVSLSKNWNAKPGDWVTKVAQFLLGRIDETQFLAAAVSADKSENQGRHCEASYYAGIKRLLAGDKTAAAADFRACLATGKTDFFEYNFSQAQLNALQPR
jgi:lipoprotein NlpI